MKLPHRRNFLQLAAGAAALPAASRIAWSMVCAFAAASLLSVAACPPAAAQTVEQFYQGKTMTIMIGVPPGGSFDLYARLAANHIKRHIPGHPNIIVEHRPGGGGIRAVTQFYAQSPRDGTVIGLFQQSIAHSQVMQPEVSKWNVAEMAYVGSLSSVNLVFVRRKDAPAKTIDEMKKITSTVGCTGRISQSYQGPAILKNLGGFQFKIVCGYPGSAEFVLALHRGEIDMVASAWNQWRSQHPGEIRDGVFIPVIQSGLRRNREIPNVPLMQEIVDDPTSKTVIEFYSAASAIGRALITPPKVPPDRLAALRGAFDKLVKDEEFLREAERIKAEVDPTPGAELQKFVLSILNAPKDIIDRANKAME
jgi:tripartite-type tricarboxylate transporter receptor subunit TctC